MLTSTPEPRWSAQAAYRTSGTRCKTILLTQLQKSSYPNGDVLLQAQTLPVLEALPPNSAPLEDVAQSSGSAGSAHWPHSGHILFHKVQLRYRDDGPWALKGVSLQVGSRKKVGIVGRTGLVPRK